jgi:glucosyl-dolichyl phosphate glucuronosyltransferase
MVEQPLLSIIVTSYSAEREKDLYELVDSIVAQTYPKIESLFVIERSRGLEENVKNYANNKAIHNLRVLFNDGKPGLSAARNLGIGEAKGDIIAFVDDDAVLFPEWAEEMVNAYDADRIIGVTGPALPLWEDEKMSWFPEEFYWIVSCTAWADWTEKTKVRNGWGMNMSFRQKAFEKAGLFSESFGLHNSRRTKWFDPPSEDVDISLRIRAKTGGNIIFNPRAKVWHRVYAYRVKQKFITQRSYSVGFQRRMLKKLYHEINGDTELLNQEYRLLNRIISKLLPSIIKNFFTNPILAWNRLRVTVTALCFVGLGYYTSFLFVRKYKTTVSGG